MNQCPCGSNIDFLTCCGLYLNGTALPKTPEALMRSRYSAYSKADIDYIKRTMKGKPLVGFNENEAKNWSNSIQWMGLSVIKAPQVGTNEQTGFVEFIATYRDRGVIKNIHEISKFQYIDGSWFYIGGEKRTSRNSRNAPCPCGSKKKYKNCHAQT